MGRRAHRIFMLSRRITRNSGEDRRRSAGLSAGKVFPGRVGCGQLGTGSACPHELRSSRRGLWRRASRLGLGCHDGGVLTAALE